MARDTIILSPEANGMFRREGLAVGSAIQTGAFVEDTDGGFQVATAAGAASMLATENIAVAEGVDYEYAVDENVFAQAVPRGALVNARAGAAVYSAGDKLEIGSDGELTALAAGVAVAVVPSFAGATVGVGGGLLTVQLL